MKPQILAFLLILSLIAPQPIAARSAEQLVTDGRSIAPTAALCLSITNASSTPTALAADLQRKFEPVLLKRLLAAPDWERIRGIVWMRDQADLAHMSLPKTDRLIRRRIIVGQLQSLAENSQRLVREMLEEAHREQRVASYRPLWIVNGIAVEGTRQAFWELASQPDVALIRQDRVRRLPVHSNGLSHPQHLATARQVQWNVERVQADRVWEALGITGAGAVVAHLDSGVDWQHPDLMTRYRGYTAKPFPIHEGNWYCATDEGYTYPGDGLGHGTHTMGIMVGQNGIGVAPGAQWIAAKVFNNQGLAYDSWIHDGFEWILAPNGDPALAPDVVNNSWGSEIGNDETFLPDVQALRAAGIFPVFSAGNDGPGSGTIASPASFRKSFAVGATDEQDLIALFSSRGPSPWGEVKPEVSAPGVDVLSALPGGALDTESGTSTAAPHVAGAVALMREADPTLTVDEMEAILTATALSLGEGQPNNDHGWGLVNAYAAVVQAGSFGRLTGEVTDANDGAVVANVTVRAISHGGGVTATTTTDTFGRYTIGLAAAHFDVTFSAFGYHAHTAYHVEITTGMTTTLDATLPPLPTGLLQGVVKEAGTGAPLPASIYVPDAPATSTADTANGSYSLALPQGTHVVRAECAAHRFVTATVIVSANESTYQDFVLEPAPSILLVDSGAWYNDSQRTYYESALEDLRYVYDVRAITPVDIVSANMPTAADLLPYDMVVWSAPQDAPAYIGAADAITSYLASGGRLLLSGQDIAYWDGGGSGFFYALYLREYLKARYVDDNASSRTLAGQGTLFAGMTITIAGAGGADNQLYPDVIASTNEDYATSAWMYQEDGSGGQAIGPCLPYRAIYLSFGFEAVSDSTSRREMLERSITWLTAPLQPAGIELQVSELPQIEQAGGWISHTVRLRNMGEVSSDSYRLDLASGAWPTALLSPAFVALGACQSTTTHISVTIPAHIGWHVYDTATLAVRSTLSPSLEAIVSLVTKTPAPVLLADGARFYHVEDQYQAALEEAGVPYDYQRIKGVWPLAIPTSDTLAMYPMVVWYTAYDWYMPLSEGEEDELIAYLERGGRLFFSSQDYLYYSHDRPLAREYLGVLNYTEDLSATVATGQAFHPIGWGLGPYTLTYPYNNWSDALGPVPEAQVAFRGQHARPIGLTHAGGRMQDAGSRRWRTAFMAFPFETLDAQAEAQVMARTVGQLSWLGSSTWSADRRTVASGSQVTMTCVLHNDGWTDIASAHLSAMLPGELSLVAGSLSPGANYNPATQEVSWEGDLAHNETVTIGLRIQVVESLPDSTYVAFPAQVGYDEHAISFDLPYILRVNAPDLAPSTLAIEPTTGSPSGTLTYTLTIRNVGVRDALATITATPPLHAAFTGTLESDEIGSGEMISQALSWNGPVGTGDRVTLRYHLALDGAGDYWLTHQAHLRDQYNEYWPIEAQAYIRLQKAYLPIVYHP